MDFPPQKNEQSEKENSQASVASAKSETTGKTRDAVNQSDSVGRSSVSRSASLIRKVAPSYPEAARQEEQEGRVVLLVQVDSSGKASRIRISDSSGHPLLDEAAREAVGRWTFHPALENGTPVFSWVKIPVAFRLSDAGS